MSRVWQCDHHAPNSCDRCDGTSAEDSLYWRATPAERRSALRDLAVWRARRTTHTDAEEAS